MKKSRFNTARKWLIFWTLFVGIGAVVGAVNMIFDPSGKTLCMDGMLPYFQVLPFADVLFQDYTFSGWALLLVNGLTNLTASVLLIKNKRLGMILGGVFGVTLMLWIGIQFYMFPANVLSTAYFLFGFAQAVTGYAAWVFSLAAPVRSFCRQAAWKVKEADYIVIHFSPGRYKNAATEMDSLLGVTHTGFTNVICRVGRFESSREETN